MGPAPPDAAITPGAPAQVTARVSEALRGAGMRCVERQGATVCDAENPRLPTLIAVYADNPPRVALAMPFRLVDSCVDVTPSLNAFNRDYDYITLSCADDRALRATGVLLLPNEGMPPAELARYAEWWKETTVATLRATRIAELLE